MKSAIFLALSASAVALPQGLDALIGGFLNMGGGGKVPDPPGAAPKRVTLTTRNPHISNSQTMKIRYGPYKIPSAKTKAINGESGVLYNYPDTTNYQKPCDDCYIMGMNAALEWPDGRVTDLKDGLWLHHMVMFNIGPGRRDATCEGSISLPHLAVLASPNNAERFFSSGNEKIPTFFNPPWANATNLGYRYNKGERTAMIVDLMNMNDEPKVAYLTITYDYIEGEHSKHFEPVKPVWLDIAQCGTSELMPKSQNGAFSYEYIWRPKFEADILGAGGHLHDGGTHLTISVDGKEVCDSVATYAAGAGQGHGPVKEGGHSAHPQSATEHISSESICSGPTFKLDKVQKSQVWTMNAYYDYTKHKGMINDNGLQDTVMGISVMYVKNAKY